MFSKFYLNIVYLTTTFIKSLCGSYKINIFFGAKNSLEDFETKQTTSKNMLVNHIVNGNRRYFIHVAK